MTKGLAVNKSNQQFFKAMTPFPNGVGVAKDSIDRNDNT